MWFLKKKEFGPARPTKIDNPEADPNLHGLIVRAEGDVVVYYPCCPMCGVLSDDARNIRSIAFENYSPRLAYKDEPCPKCGMKTHSSFTRDLIKK